MSKTLVSGRYLVSSALWVWFVGCGLDPTPPNRNGGTAPVSSGVTLSGGAGPRNDADASAPGENARITDIESSTPSDSRAASEAMPAGGRAGAFAGTAEIIGGASSHGAGSGEEGGSADSGEEGGSAGAPSTVAEIPPTLWFSEYVEGSSSNKALEITALNRSELEGCKVSTYFNGKVEATVVATLNGVLEAGQVLTLCTSSLKDALPDRCGQVGNLTFNGDDAIAVSCNGTVLDVIGQIGVDPGVAWGAEPNSTADHTLRRKCGIQGGDPLGSDAFDPSADWQTQPVDTFDGLGSLGC